MDTSTNHGWNFFTVFATFIIALTLSTPRLTAQDVEFIGVLKSQEFVQDNPIVPSLPDSEDEEETESALLFEAFADQNPTGQIASATLEIPGGAIKNLVDDDGEWIFEQPFDKVSRLDEVYVDGTYTLTINTVHDGTQIIPLNVSGNTYPNIPRVSNYLEAQAIDAGADFTLTWDAFSGAGPNDFIFLEIEEIDPFGGFNLIYESDFLDPTTASMLLPAGTFTPGSEYEAFLIFVKIVDFDDTYVDALGGYFRETTFEMHAVGGTDTTSPFLEDARPNSFANEVPVRSVIAFDFNEPMNTNLTLTGSVALTGLAAIDFTYQWSSDSLTLFCIPDAPLPAATTINWTLNPLPTPLNLRDTSGNILAPNMSGQFNTSTFDPGPGPDASNIILLKGIDLCQTDNSGSQLSGITFAFLNVNQTAVNSVLSLELLPLGGTGIPIPNDSSDRSLEAESVYPSQADLDSFFPDGNYLVGLNTAHDGFEFVTLSASGAYPNNPSIVNFDAAQAIDSTQSFTFQWVPFAGGTINDPVFFRLDNDSGDSIIQSTEPGQPGSLSGASPPSFEIPAGTLTPGTTYDVELSFIRLVDSDTNSYPGVSAFAGFQKILEFTVKTAGTPPAPSLHATDFNFGSFNLVLSGLTNYTYALDASTDMSTWHSIATQTTMGDSFNFFDFDSSLFSQRFYRARTFNFIDGVGFQGSVVNSFDFSPIQGAIVSTSLDGVTAITDFNGNFTLAAGVTGDFSETAYDISASAPGFSSSVETRFWGNQPGYVFITLDSIP